MTDRIRIPATSGLPDPWGNRYRSLRLGVMVFIEDDGTAALESVSLDLWDDPIDGPPYSVTLTLDAARQLAEEITRQADRLTAALNQHTHSPKGH